MASFYQAFLVVFIWNDTEESEDESAGEPQVVDQVAESQAPQQHARPRFLKILLSQTTVSYLFRVRLSQKN